MSAATERLRFIGGPADGRMIYVERGSSRVQVPDLEKRDAALSYGASAPDLVAEITSHVYIRHRFGFEDESRFFMVWHRMSATAARARAAELWNAP